MSLTICDAPRCNARALVRWTHLRDDLTDSELHYCGHCSDAIGPLMLDGDQRWARVKDERDEWAREANAETGAPSAASR